MPIDTNIVIFTLEDGISTKHFLDKLTDMDVHIYSIILLNYRIMAIFVA